MNKKKINIFSLSYYSLITQIIIINIIIAFIGLIFVGVLNFILLNNNKHIQKKTDQMNQQIINIKNYLEQNAIIELPLFSVSRSRLESTVEASEIIYSSPQLDPYVSQLYLENRFLYQSCNSRWIVTFATRQLFFSSIASKRKCPRQYSQLFPNLLPYRRL